jgi:hypothetical protein
MADQIRATPRNSLAALLSDAINSGVGYMKSPQRTQQLQGLGRLIESTGIPYTVESLSYDPSGRGLFTGVGGLGGTTRMRPEALEAAMTVAPMVGPTARLAGRGLMSAGMAGERVAERVVPQIMERGGLPAELLQGMSRGTVSPLDVYHGSPYRLQPTAANPLGEFDASKIGTGAGAQRYGFGIYTSESPQFADMFAIRKGLPDLEGIARQNGLELSQEARVELIRQATRDSKGKPVRGMKDDKYIDPVAAVRKLQNASIETRQMPADKLQTTIREFQEQNKAYLYKADLPDEKIARMLDWEKPLSQQHPDVKAALKGIESKFSEIPDFNLRKWMDTDPLASTFHNVLQRDLGADPAFIANVFRERGIPGITYKDLDTRNFVTFPGEEKSIKILERNGETAANPFYTDPFGNTIADTTR